MNNKIFAVLLTAYGLLAAPSVWAQNGFDIQAGGDGRINTGNCHMGYCSWSKTVRNKIIHQNHTETRVETTLIGGRSYHEDDYPNGTPVSADIKWNKKPHTVTVVCSRQNPQVIIGNQIDELDFHCLPDILFSSGNLYFAICHNHHNGFETGRIKFAY